jgi:hypothetical protein
MTCRAFYGDMKFGQITSTLLYMIIIFLCINHVYALKEGLTQPFGVHFITNYNILVNSNSCLLNLDLKLYAFNKYTDVFVHALFLTMASTTFLLRRCVKPIKNSNESSMSITHSFDITDVNFLHKIDQIKVLLCPCPSEVRIS